VLTSVQQASEPTGIHHVQSLGLTLVGNTESEKTLDPMNTLLGGKAKQAPEEVLSLTSSETAVFSPTLSGSLMIFLFEKSNS
jgi:hypothetical protein